MKRWLTSLSLFVFLSIAALSCGTYQSQISKDVNLPPADPQVLYKYITQENRYDTWDLWPGKGKLYEGKPPHGAFLTTYLNRSAVRSIKAQREMADGAIIVKENYTPEKEIAAVTVMYKIKGYHRVAGDWFWAKYGADGSVQKAGKVDGCINCHGAKKANDYIFTSDFVSK
jgi:hypothetical protein